MHSFEIMHFVAVCPIIQTLQYCSINAILLGGGGGGDVILLVDNGVTRSSACFMKLTRQLCM